MELDKVLSVEEDDDVESEDRRGGGPGSRSSSLAGALLALLAKASCFSRCFLPLAGLVWMRMWRVSSSERLNRFSQPGCVQAWGFSPVCVRMWRV